ncbi:cysteine desulfurase [Myxococcota bacterium]|nr:cysteine desulfurase [Myxococcota bacterium]
MSTAERALVAPLDVEKVRADFPILSRSVHGKPLVFLDSAASSQKPQVVIDAMSEFYSSGYANIHRGLYELSAEATRRYEAVREITRNFIGAGDAREIVFVRNATEAINLVAHSWGRSHVSEGDEVLISAMEHHANIVPWQMLCEEKGAVLRVVPINDRGEIELEALEQHISSRTRMISVCHVSNALGTINPVDEIVSMAHARGIPILLDGAQAVPHMKVNVEEIGCDFYVFSGHKLFGPSGAGVLYGRLELLDAMPPFLGGGDMIESVSFEKTTYAEVPQRFEAGTPDIAGVIGLGAAIEYLESVGWDAIEAWEVELMDYAVDRLAAIPEVRVIGTARRKVPVLSFDLEGVHPHDVAMVLDQEGVAVRAGHHCAQPVMERFEVPATTRATLAFYNTRSDVDALVRGLEKVLELFD